MSLKDRIEQDLKTAMLSGNKALVNTLKNIKSAILYEEVALGLRDKGLDDKTVINVLVKETKKRQESADLYRQGGNEEKAQAELAEKQVLETYLPEQLSEAELIKVIDAVLSELKVNSASAMGQVISEVRARTSGQADGAIIARLVKEKLQ